MLGTMAPITPETSEEDFLFTAYPLVYYVGNGPKYPWAEVIGFLVLLRKGRQPWSFSTILVDKHPVTSVRDRVRIVVSKWPLQLCSLGRSIGP